MDDQKIIKVYIGKEGVRISIANTLFIPNWFRTKDMHPRSDELSILRDIVFKNSGEYYIIYIPPSKRIEEIIKLKNNWRLYNTLCNDYINSVEGFEYILDGIMKEIKDELSLHDDKK